MIDINNIKKYFENDDVLVSDHAAMRFNQRGIKIKEIRSAVDNGEIIEQYPEDYPYPSCLILGKTSDAKPVHVVISDEGSMCRIITAYFPDPDKWDLQFRVRKEQ